jgi:hypothetical protein
MYELPVVVDLAREVGIPLVGGLEDYLGAIGEFMRCEVDFAKGSFSNQPSKSVVTDRLQIVAREFVEKLLIRAGKLCLAHKLSLSF